MTTDTMTRISRARAVLILEHPFIGTIALNMQVKITSDVPTAATDGKSLLFNPDFVAPLTNQQVLFLVAHECLHPILEHNYRTFQRDRKRWNIAGDYIINQMLVDERVGQFIPDGWLDKAVVDAGGGTTDGVYALLEQQPQQCSGSGNGKGSPTRGGGLDNDILPAAATAAEAEAAAAEMKVIVAQAAQAARMAGKLSANMERLVGEVLTPKVDWRDVMQRFIQRARTDQRSFARPNRRFVFQGLSLPTISGETLGEVVFAVDMSGSIGNREVAAFRAECQAVFEDLRPTKLHFMFFDSVVCGHDVLTPDDDFVFNPRGGGGTAFSPVFRRIDDENINPVAVVFLTDLCCSDFGPQPDYPVLWITTERGSAPFGEITKISI